MDIKKEIIKKNHIEVPCVTFKPSKSVGAVVVAHSYGGMKEETIGLAWHIAREGFTTGAIDLRGHGEHPFIMDNNILLDLETAISYFEKYGKVTAIGHSLGGRLSLISNADYAIGISPPLKKTIKPQFIKALEDLRDYRVRKSDYNLSQLLYDLSQPQFDPDKSLIIYGTNDLPEIVTDCEKLKSKDLPVIGIEKAQHSDIFLYEPTFKTVNQKLREWYGIN